MPKIIGHCGQCGHYDIKLYRCLWFRKDTHPSDRGCYKYVDSKKLRKCGNCKHNKPREHSFKIVVGHCQLNNDRMVSKDNWCERYEYDYPTTQAPKRKAKPHRKRGARPGKQST